MPVNRKLVEAWRAWLDSSPPTENFRLRRYTAPTFGVEMALDHLHNGLRSLSSAVIEGEGRHQHPELASEQLAELSKMSAELEAIDLSDDDREKFRNYISLARGLLEELSSYTALR